MTIITSRRTTPAADARIDDTSSWLLLYCAVAQRKIGREEKERGRHVRALGDSNCYWLEMDSAVEGHRAIRGWMHGWKETRERRLKGEGDWSKNKPLGIFQNKNKKTKNFFFFFFFSYFIITFLFFSFFFAPFYLFDAFLPSLRSWQPQVDVMWLWPQDSTLDLLRSSSQFQHHHSWLDSDLTRIPPQPYRCHFPLPKWPFYANLQKSNQINIRRRGRNWNGITRARVSLILFYFILFSRLAF